MTKTSTAARSRADLSDARVASAVDRHFDPRSGSRFWLERAAALGFDPRSEVRTAADLPRLGPLTREELAARPLRDLVPLSLHAELPDMLLSETGGTTGAPLRCVYADDEFEQGFVKPFAVAAQLGGFPRSGDWLFVGPSGPHVIHRAARAFAHDAGALDPFSVDFDPRWARAQTPGSLGARLYRHHVVEQAAEIVEREDVTVLFSTPPVLDALAERMDEDRRLRVRGIHVGGMAFSAEDRATLKDGFPNATILPAYGNSLAGIAPELGRPAAGEPVRYSVPRGRIRYRVVRPRSDGSVNAEALHDAAAVGERGRVVLDRVDRSFLLANLVERDEATVGLASAEAIQQGFQRHVLIDPGPACQVPVEGGLY